MFDRFTDRARRVIVLAQDEARRLKHSYIGTEHILLGIVLEGEGIGARVLETLGLSLELVQVKVEEIVGVGYETPTGHIPFTPRAKRVFEQSMREALRMNHPYIGTEHIVLALIEEGEGVAAQVLKGVGLTLEQVREQTHELLAGGLLVHFSRPLYDPHVSLPVRRKTLEAELAELQGVDAWIERRLAEIDEALRRVCPRCDFTMHQADQGLICQVCGHMSTESAS